MITFDEQTKADAAAILEELGTTIEVFLDGVKVRTFTGRFLENVETISPGSMEQIILRPVIIASAANFEGLGRSHTFRVNENSYRPYGDPARETSLGWVKQYLVR